MIPHGPLDGMVTRAPTVVEEIVDLADRAVGPDLDAFADRFQLFRLGGEGDGELRSRVVAAAMVGLPREPLSVDLARNGRGGTRYKLL